MSGWFPDRIKTRQVRLAYVALSLFWVVIAAGLYYLGVIRVWGFTLAILVIVIFVCFALWATRVAQKDGFIDGFKDGRNGVKKKVSQE